MYGSVANVRAAAEYQYPRPASTLRAQLPSSNRQRRRSLCLCSHSYTGIDMSEARSGGAAPAADKAVDYRLPTDVYPKVRP